MVEGTAPLAVSGVMFRLVINFVIGCAFAGFPGDVQSAVQDADADHIRRARGLGWQRLRRHGGGGLPFPAPVNGGDREEIGFQILQARDLRLGHVHLNGTLLPAVAEPVVYPVAGHIGQRPPPQADPAVARIGGEIFDLAVGLDGGLRHDVLQKPDGFHRSVFAALGAGNGNGDLLHCHPAAQRNGDYSGAGDCADTMNIRGQGIIKGNFVRAAVIIFHPDRSGQYFAGAFGGSDLDLRHLHGLFQGHPDLRLPLRSGQCDGLSIILEDILQDSAGGRALCQDDAFHRRGQQGGGKDLRAVFNPDIAADAGQIVNINGSVAVQVILR